MAFFDFPEQLRKLEEEKAKQEITPQPSVESQILPQGSILRALTMGRSVGPLAPEALGLSPLPPLEPTRTVDEIASAEIPPKPSRELKEPSAPITLPELEMAEAGIPTEGTVENLRKAQQARNLLKLGAGLQQAVELAGEALTGKKPQLEIFQKQAQQAEQLVEDFKERVKQEKFDPQSDVSKQLRAFAKRFNITIPDTMPASTVETIMPSILRAFEAEESRKQQKELQKERLETQKEIKRDTVQAKQEANKEKEEINKEKDDNRWVEKTSAFLTKSKQSDALSTVRKAKSLVDRIDASSPNAINDITALYSLIRALDPGSVVREGEIALAQRARGLWGTVDTQLSQLGKNPRLLNKKVLIDIKNTLTQLHDIGEKEYKSMVEPFANQAKRRFKEGWEERWIEVDPLSAKMIEQPKEMKTIVKRGYNPKTNQTELVYSDGSRELVSGRQ